MILDIPAEMNREPVGLLPWESPDYRTLEWLPLALRFKLDRLRIKLHLKQWQAFTLEDRQQLLRQPFASQEQRDAFHRSLRQCLQAAVGEALEPLPDAGSEDPLDFIASRQPPEAWLAAWRGLGLDWDEGIWENLSPFLRYALVKAAWARMTESARKENARAFGSIVK